MKPSLDLRLGHQLTMTPRLQQAIRLLQLSTTELRLEIENQLQTNPMLEYDETVLDEMFTQSSQAMAHVETLQEKLLWQTQLAHFSQTQILIATALIDAINDDGYLSCSLEEIIQTLKPDYTATLDQVQTILKRIQQFEPIGSGARNLAEYLTIQIDYKVKSDHPLRETAKELVQHHLALLAKRQFGTLCRRLQVTQDELQTVINLIQSLNPRPQTLCETRFAYAIPDLQVSKSETTWKVTLNQKNLPKIKINTIYQALVRDNKKNTPLKEQLREALGFLQSLKRRNETLLQVGECIVNAQSSFFEKGEVFLNPLSMKTVAAQLNLSESTVSRIARQKYMATPQGTFELRYFFASHATKAICAKIKKIILAENPSTPLSDTTLTQLLLKEGFSLARRTITKYREILLIPPAHIRKQLI